MSPPLEYSHHIGPIFSAHIPFHTIQEHIRFTVHPVDGVAVHFKCLRKNFKEEWRVLFAMGVKILFRQYTLAPCWSDLGLLDYKANTLPIALAGPSNWIVYPIALASQLFFNLFVIDLHKVFSYSLYYTLSFCVKLRYLWWEQLYCSLTNAFKKRNLSGSCTIF